MSVSITIRGVPDDVHDELVARAAREGESLEKYLLEMLGQVASRPSAADVLARARTRVTRVGSHVDAEAILGARDAGRR